MEHDFWHQRWQEDQIGFHQQDINPHLQRYWPQLPLDSKSRVFVPLCGKSRDMLWLMSMGHSVVGVEISPLAVKAFFSENGMQPIVRHHENFMIYQVDGLQIFCGDFFALKPEDIGIVDAVYDRASLVALPPEMRVDYVFKLATLLPAKVQMLLIAFDYPQHEMQGPPFCVHQQEVEQLFGPWCNVELMASLDVLEQEAHFKERGLSSLTEQAYHLSVR